MRGSITRRWDKFGLVDFLAASALLAGQYSFNTMPRLHRNLADIRRDAKRGNDYYADMAGKPRMKYPAERPKRAAPVRDPRRVSEADVNKDIRRAADERDDLVLWRNNRGHVDLPGGGRIMYGLGPNGSADWIGYKRLTIMPNMVGSEFALFVCVEAKSPQGVVRPNQREFLDRVNADGGAAIIARDGKDLDKI